MHEESGKTTTAVATGRLIVCERSGTWAAALRRELSAAGISLGETRSLAECWESLAAAAASFLLVELTPEIADALLQSAARLPRDYPLARWAAAAARPLAHWQWLLREAGAVDFVVSPRRLGPLAEAICRHLASVPPPPQSLTERIWAGLPWEEEEGLGIGN